MESGAAKTPRPCLPLPRRTWSFSGSARLGFIILDHRRCRTVERLPGTDSLPGSGVAAHTVPANASHTTENGAASPSTANVRPAPYPQLTFTAEAGRVDTAIGSGCFPSTEPSGCSLANAGHLSKRGPRSRAKHLLRSPTGGLGLHAKLAQRRAAEIGSAMNPFRRPGTHEVHGPVDPGTENARTKDARQASQEIAKATLLDDDGIGQMAHAPRASPIWGDFL